MKDKKRINVLSQFLFDEKCKAEKLNDDNVENTNKAFISIIGTEECLKYYLEEEDTKHYFKDHPNVLNLEFDDIDCDVIYNGHHFKTMSMKQAEQTVDFIEKIFKSEINGIDIHCRAGMSRSRAVAEFIYRYCRDNDIECEYQDRNDYTTMLNFGVLKRLNHAYWKKYKMNMYKDNLTEYPEELTNIPLRIINRERNRAAYKLNEQNNKRK